MSKEQQDEPTISANACQADLDKWFTHKRIRPSEREANKVHETNMLECMKEGLLTINTESMEMTYKLVFPIGETTKELKLKSRIQVFERNSISKKDPNDGDGRCAAVLSVLSGVNSNLILKFDSVDFGALQSIAIYFL